MSPQLMVLLLLTLLVVYGLYWSLERSSNHAISVPELQNQLLLPTAALLAEHFTASNSCVTILKFLLRNYSELTPAADGVNVYNRVVKLYLHFK